MAPACGHPLAAPLFMGANPAQVWRNDQVIVAPLLHKEELARTVIAALQLKGCIGR